MFRLALPVFFLLFMAACGPSDDVVIVNTYTDSGSEAELDVGDAVDKGSDDTHEP